MSSGKTAVSGLVGGTFGVGTPAILARGATAVTVGGTTLPTPPEPKITVPPPPPHPATNMLKMMALIHGRPVEWLSRLFICFPFQLISLRTRRSCIASALFLAGEDHLRAPAVPCVGVHKRSDLCVSGRRTIRVTPTHCTLAHVAHATENGSW